MTSAEAWALAALAIPASTILGAYALDSVGLTFGPWLMLPLVVACSGGVAVYARRRSAPAQTDTRVAVAIGVGLTAWLLWLARPTLMPLSTGPDLTHHLLLVDYIERHWRLVHDQSLARLLGEMAQYTAGSHIVAALVGAWSGRGGLHVFHAVQCVAVALEAGFLYLIAVRLLPARSPRALGAVGVLLLLAAPRYFLGAFTDYGFFAQVIAEVFAVAMWWAAAAWDDEPDWRLSVVAGFAGASAFLTWPVYTGAPSLAFFLVVVLRRQTPWAQRARHLLVAFVPLTAVAGAYLIGRLGWLQLAGTGGSAPWPSIASFGVPLVVLALAGLMLAAARRRGRATVLFVGALVAQTLALYVVALRSGAPQPYMALKMFYLVLRPMTVCAGVAVAALWQLCWSSLRSVRGDAAFARWEARSAWLMLGAVFVLVAWPLWKTPSALHPKPPAVSAPLFEAGVWARDNLPVGCVEYLVGDDETAYWLHLAVLGNPRISDRTGDNSTYEPKDAVLRWLTPNGLPYAIADLGALSRDVRSDLEIVRAFGTAAVVRRRGLSTCAAVP
ncbi:MAG: hypothetical protein ABMA15_07105 [Vicinamibacterales bacterium]